MPRRSRVLALALLLLVLVTLALPAAAAPEGTLTIGLHVTLVSRWLDPGETEALITPFMVLCALHDGLVKPMPGGLNTPSLAESWTVSKDGTAYGRHTLVAPIFQQAFIWGVGPRVAEAGAGLIEGYPYAAPCEDLKLK